MSQTLRPAPGLMVSTGNAGPVCGDIEAFAVPVLTVLQPEAAGSILDYRFRTLQAAYKNARLMGRRGAQFAWESAPSTGDEAAPLPASTASVPFWIASRAVLVVLSANCQA